jgi:hypothetical protein
VFVGNISAPSKTTEQQPSNSYDVCGPYTAYIPKTTRPERGKYIFTFIYVYLFIFSYVNYISILMFIVFNSCKVQAA